MIDDLDRSLRKLFELEFGAPLPFELSFAIPDKEFKPVSTQRATLNCYLYDIRENRELRDTGRHMERQAGGQYALESPPCRVKASYCITAWSPGDATTSVEPQLDEHNLLAAVLRALLRHAEFPRDALVGALASQPLALPTQVAQPESTRNSGDFWNAVGGQLRPSLEYSVTLALGYESVQYGPLVTSVQARVGSRDGAARVPAPDADVLRSSGGVVRGGPEGRPVAGAWVRVDETGELAVADAQGQFVLYRLTPGAFTLRARAPGYHEASQAVTLPLAAGSFDFNLDPL